MRYLILSLMLFPLFAVSTTVTLDGKVINAERVEITTKKAPDPAPTPVPTPPPSGDCVAPTRTTIDWSSPGGRKDVNIGPGGLIYAFTTTSNPGYGGYINLFEQAGQEGVTRRVTISSCPGKPLPDRMCSRTGTGLLKVGWLQRAYRGACSLETNTRYYLEIENVNGCSGTCGAYLTIPTNGRSQ